MVDVSFNLNNFEYFILIMIRILSFVTVAPIFGNNAVPRKVKVGLSFFVSLIIYNSIYYPALNYDSIFGYAVIVFMETVTGLLTGYGANICSSIIFFAGNVIDMDIGFSMVTEFSPETNSEVTITGNFYYYLVMLLLLISDMHTYVLRAVCDSFQLVPIGGSSFQWDSLLLTMTKFITDTFVIGFRIFLPFFACIMILNCILGIMAKVSPQMNMFSVGMQLKVLTGLVVMLLTIFLLPRISEYIFDEIKFIVRAIIEGMHT